MIGREMRRESVRQPEFGRQHRAEMARSENPQRHFRSRRRHGLDALAGARGRQEGLQLQNVLREVLGRLRRTAQRAQRELIGAWRPAKPEIDAAGKKPRQGSELLGDDIGRVVRQHDAPRPDPNCLRPLGEMSEHDGCRGAGDARHVVVLRHPDAPVAQCFRVGGEVASIVEGAARVRFLRDANQLEDGERRHGTPAAGRPLVRASSASRSRRWPRRSCRREAGSRTPAAGPPGCRTVLPYPRDRSGNAARSWCRTRAWRRRSRFPSGGRSARTR